jgi:hypothetical protein
VPGYIWPDGACIKSNRGAAHLAIELGANFSVVGPEHGRRRIDSSLLLQRETLGQQLAVAIP